MGEKFHNLVEGKCSLYVTFRAGSLNGVVGSLSDTITEPSKFSGADHHWDDWNYQLRSYLEAKGWLQTYDHPTGPGTAGFDTEINKKL